jgi:hypothetical protein
VDTFDLETVRLCFEVNWLHAWLTLFGGLSWWTGIFAGPRITSALARNQIHYPVCTIDLETDRMRFEVK